MSSRIVLLARFATNDDDDVMVLSVGLCCLPCEVDDRKTTTSLEFVPGKVLFGVVVNLDVFGSPQRVSAAGVAWVDDDDDVDGCEDGMRDVAEAGPSRGPLLGLGIENTMRLC